MASAESLAETAAGALLEDEALRGDLTDAGFGLVMDWATQLVVARAAGWLRLPDPRAAMWDDIARIKGLVRGIVGAAEAIAPEPLLDVAGPLAGDVADALANVDWSDDPDANARALVGALARLPWAGADVAQPESDAEVVPEGNA